MHLRQAVAEVKVADRHEAEMVDLSLAIEMPAADVMATLTGFCELACGAE